MSPVDSIQLFFTYTFESKKGKGSTKLASANFQAPNKLLSVKTILQTNSESSESIHFGSRIEFDNQGHLFFTVGDRNDRPKAQDLAFHNGKILRLNLDGTVPKDNFRNGREIFF